LLILSGVRAARLSLWRAHCSTEFIAQTWIRPGCVTAFRLVAFVVLLGYKKQSSDFISAATMTCQPTRLVFGQILPAVRRLGAPSSNDLDSSDLD